MTCMRPTELWPSMDVSPLMPWLSWAITALMTAIGTSGKVGRQRSNTGWKRLTLKIIQSGGGSGPGGQGLYSAFPSQMQPANMS